MPAKPAKKANGKMIEMVAVPVLKTPINAGPKVDRAKLLAVAELISKARDQLGFSEALDSMEQAALLLSEFTFNEKAERSWRKSKEDVERLQDELFHIIDDMSVCALRFAVPSTGRVW